MIWLCTSIAVLSLLTAWLNIRKAKRLPTSDTELVSGRIYEVVGFYEKPIHLIFIGFGDGGRVCFKFPCGRSYNDAIIPNEVWVGCGYRALSPENICLSINQ